MPPPPSRPIGEPPMTRSLTSLMFPGGMRAKTVELLALLGGKPG
jgi:hypothetical protein